MLKKIFINSSILFSLRNLSTIAQKNPKPFSKIPTVSIFKLITGSLPGGKYYKKSLLDIGKLLNEEYGEILRIPSILGNDEMIIIFKADDIETVFRNEGIWPTRKALVTLKYYREKYRSDIYSNYGSILTGDGEKWYKTRTTVNPILLKPKVVESYRGIIDEVAKDLVEEMKNIRNDKSEMPGNFLDIIVAWSAESIVSVVLGKRLNMLSGRSNDENAQKLMNCIRQFLEQSAQFELGVSLWRYYESKAFKELMKVFENLTNITSYFVNEALEKFENEKGDENVENSVFVSLLKINKEITTVMVMDALTAGVDTTALILTNLLYMLAKNPKKQEILRKEIFQFLPEKSSIPSYENMKQLSYLRACVKETFRTMPLILGSNRVIQNDVVLSGYQVPKNKNIALTFTQELVNPKYYPEPQKFIPERWLRDRTDNECPHATESNPFSFMPFGHGSRSCIGKRIANMEIELATANIIRNFKLEWHYPDIKIRNALFNIPDSEMKIKVLDV